MHQRRGKRARGGNRGASSRFQFGFFFRFSFSYGYFWRRAGFWFWNRGRRARAYGAIFKRKGFSYALEFGRKRIKREFKARHQRPQKGRRKQVFGIAFRCQKMRDGDRGGFRGFYQFW